MSTSSRLEKADSALGGVRAQLALALVRRKLTKTELDHLIRQISLALDELKGLKNELDP